MPRDYGMIRHGFWSGTGETSRQLRKLPMDVRTVAAYLMSCGSSNMIGLYYLPLPIIAHEIGSGLTTEGALKALRSLEALGFSYYDEQTETVFVLNMAREQIAKTLAANDKQRNGVIALLKEYEKSRFVADFVRIYGAAYHLPDDLVKAPPPEDHGRPFEGPSKPESRDQGSESRDPDLCPPAEAGGPGELELDFSEGQEAPTEPTEAEQVRAVFAHYRSKHPRAFLDPQSGTKEWRLIVARLKEGSTVEDLCDAIDGYHLSPHHQGFNDRNTKYLGLELMVRDGTHVQQGLEFKAHPPKMPGRIGASAQAEKRPARATAAVKVPTGPKPGAYAAEAAQDAAQDRGPAHVGDVMSNVLDNLAAKGAIE